MVVNVFLHIEVVFTKLLNTYCLFTGALECNNQMLKKLILTLSFSSSQVNNFVFEKEVYLHNCWS